MKKYIIIFCLIFVSQLFSYSLDDMEMFLEKNYPIFNNNENYNQISMIDNTKIKKELFPQFSLIGQFSDQSETIELPISSPMFNVPKADTQRKQFILNIDQIIFDGGVNREKQKLSQIKMQIENTTNEVKLETLKEKLFALYFSVLFQREKLQINQNLKYNLEQKLISAKKTRELGVIQDRSVYLLESEIIKIEQNIIEIESALSTLYQNISILTGQNITNESPFELPTNKDNDYYKEEYELFDFQIKSLESNHKLNSKLKLPKLFANAQLGYGNPGLNSFNDEWHDFYSYSIQFKWDIWNWNKFSSEQKIINQKIKLLENEKSAFSKSLKMKKQESYFKISKLKSKIENDKKLLRIKQKISEITNSQFENGISTSLDVIDDNTAVANTEISLKLNKLQLLYEEIYNEKYLGKIK